MDKGAGALVGDNNAPAPLRPPASAPASVLIFLARFKNHWLQITLKGANAAPAKEFRVWSVTLI